MKVLVAGILAVICVGLGLATGTAMALSSVAISQVQTGDANAASNEAVELFNNSTTDQDITNWCIRYTTAATDAVQPSPKYCFVPSDLQTKIFLSTHSYAVIATTGYVMPGSISPDGRFSGSGMASTGGQVKLLNASGASIDTVGWGASQFAEGYIVGLNPAPAAPTSAQALWRKSAILPLLQDTDNNRDDFEIKIPSVRSGGIYEVRTAIDLCPTLSDVQEILPAGYRYDEAGNCELLSSDLCANLPAIQVVLPDNLTADGLGGCYEDVCPNLSELQRSVPTGYAITQGRCEKLEDRVLWLSELLPNVSGSDTDHEFIELYNPHDEPIVLDGYTLQIGDTYQDTYLLESGDDSASIPAHGYVVYTNAELNFTLLNTVNNVRLRAPAGNIVSDTSYSEPKDDQSWALIDGVWAYTNHPTPGYVNVAMTAALDDAETVSSELAPCPSGKYRHPITNRCRNIEGDTAMLVACDADEYRNPETNRCRKTATLAAALAPCNDGYERNPDTNRCRKLTSTSGSVLAACTVGYERNPTTNRCRKMGSPSSTSASAIATTTTNSPLTTALIASAGVSVVGYGFYEWRTEIWRIIARLIALVPGK